ncbi:4-phosphoerythronate dehydrogenase [Acinetobacter haemolyticus]|uniref:Erythronate-4-phosphate dehydrogenase n=1 Tax=Acinetobacter haemolyticus TaxID=29430 RepID=A0A1L6KP85_ACIHA|nr:4-phosphoerythronate dehydrogenase [Acinetobacter haemolyticus]APR70897.1 erythronate-4-phosphate dehydrogenase [Acinetobacter haemolyticus]MCU4386075.1 4-phosphoerythronate dehydrogenase [Acinetobacter haemolyticus]QBQ16752.1 4-phosphoerythronate dehydrogenase [Acinetobacter haemolyticus]
MKIIADENLAFTDYFFAEFAEIQHRAGRTLTHADVRDADALLVRSVTKVNHALIDQTKIQFVGSATIGTDHLDIQTLENQNISWSNAAGCNAQAVAEYVITALLHLDIELLEKDADFTLGIVGLGNVGSRLAVMAQLLGWNVIGYDPYVQLNDIENVSFDTLLARADAISIHVPLTLTGEYPTQHLFNQATLAAMKPSAILINSARGSVIQQSALMADMMKTKRQVVLDVFEFEPEIPQDLLDLLALATPHIAGYSLEGKARGTQMIYDAFCQKFGYTASKRFESQLPSVEQYFEQHDLKEVLKQRLPQIYNISEDDRQLRACVQHGKVDQQAFDLLRKNYPLRREWAAHGGPKA